ncbi:hypothetical protein M413DRAFT_30714 [Hebeloma cylindrosporum]|uniref:Uncharacterized protein n=1 Tax=Hebeloma cylindrosporum TaxID=76867 RepID=A0A0C2XJ06_HEBCY|nr:hypothetical protein M413DRAFT_30714 [Hebeloma cylindrosporum h7]
MLEDEEIDWEIAEAASDAGGGGNFEEQKKKSSPAKSRRTVGLKMSSDIL